MSRQRICVGMLLGMLLTLAWLSFRLATIRMYQVDECQNVYMARVLATGESSRFFTNASLFLLGPLSWLSRNAVQSADLFLSARFLFCAVFWTNLLLIASIAGGRLLSVRGCVALTAAATLAPLWDYGFEIRHDNLLLTGLLLIWWLIRGKSPGSTSYLFCGGITVALLFVAVKSLVYVLPLTAALLIFRPVTQKRTRWQLALAWVAGALLAVGIIRIGYGRSGAWDTYLAVFRGVTRYSANSEGAGNRFWPWNTLARLLTQAPLLLALSSAACVATALDVFRRKRAALAWEGLLPETLLFLGSLGALLANPTPYPYNLVNVVPFAFILAFKYAAVLWAELEGQKQFWAFAITILVCAHLLPFALATQRHLQWPNARQRELMRLAEALTDPATDTVYDGIGMVPTRPSIDYQWYIHSLNMGLFKQPGRRVRDLLTACPAAVFIPSYRTDWLPQPDHDFISKRYVPLADDFWVLGTVLPAGGGSFEIAHRGRYRIAPMPGSDFPEATNSHDPAPMIGGTLDGAPLPVHPVELEVGTHRIEAAGDCRPAVVWVGPHLNQVEGPGPGDHQTLFVNWY